MNIQELFRRLSYGELSNLSLGSDGGGMIRADRQNQVTHYVNEALLRLHSRFVLRESFIPVRQHMHITNYQLTSQFAATNTSPPPNTTQFILDTLETPFRDDLVKVLGVYDRFNKKLPLNDSECLDGVFTPQPLVLQVPFPEDQEVLGVVYQAGHPRIEYEDMEAEVGVPVVLEGALTAYIAHLIYSNMNGQEHLMKATAHLNTYDLICTEVAANDLVNSAYSNSHSKLHDRGFV